MPQAMLKYKLRLTNDNLEYVNKARKTHNKIFTTPIPFLEQFSYVCWFKEEEPITWVNNDSLLIEYQSINFEEFKKLFKLE